MKLFTNGDLIENEDNIKDFFKKEFIAEVPSEEYEEKDEQYILHKRSIKVMDIED